MFTFTPIPGEMIQFDYIVVFFNGLKPPTRCFLCRCDQIHRFAEAGNQPLGHQPTDMNLE